MLDQEDIDDIMNGLENEPNKETTELLGGLNNLKNKFRNKDITELMEENLIDSGLKEQYTPFEEVSDDKEAEEDTIGTMIKNPVGRPKGIPQTEFQKAQIKKFAMEYQRKVKAGEIVPPEPVTHGAYSYMNNQKISKTKRHYLKFVYDERKKWLDELGGEENLSSLELSMLDEAARLLMYSTLVNAHLMKGEKEIVFTDENGETKMHTALSRNYLSFTKTYISILKELQKISTTRHKKGRGGDAASRLQNLYNK